jgi:hypothetical protein
MGEIRNTHKILVGKPERKKLLGRTRRRWEDNIRMDLEEIGYDGLDWIPGSGLGSVAGSCEHGN